MSANQPIEIEHKVIEFIARETGFSVKDITSESDLFKDLGIDGDDATELITKFGQKFNIDMSNFNFTKHFGSEGSFIPFLVFFPSWWKSRCKLKPITISDLVKAAESEAWYLE
jgi:acyl carrier protein